MTKLWLKLLLAIFFVGNLLSMIMTLTFLIQTNMQIFIGVLTLNLEQLKHFLIRNNG